MTKIFSASGRVSESLTGARFTQRFKAHCSDDVRRPYPERMFLIIEREAPNAGHHTPHRATAGACQRSCHGAGAGGVVMRRRPS